MPQKIKLDHAGIEAVLKSAAVGSVVAELAEDVASRVYEVASDGEEIPVTTSRYTTDRAAAAVTMAHAAGLAKEARHGSLAKAAAASGLEVTARS